MTGSRTQFERISAKIKNNKIVAIIIFIGTVVIAVSTFTNAARNLMDFMVIETRPALNGEWKAEVSYDWPNAVYSETFVFNGGGDEIYGTASFLGYARGIVEGTVDGGSLQFTTQTEDDGRTAVHHYRGSIAGDEIWFTMQTKGGSSEHIPIEFRAQRTTGRAR